MSEENKNTPDLASDNFTDRSFEEILRHKWIESEKQGKDIGFERALLDWIRKHRESWRSSRNTKIG